VTNSVFNTLKQVDLFHKNCLLLFEDIIACVRAKTLSSNMTDLLGPEGSYQFSNATESEYRRQFIFDYNGRIRFVFMLVKTKEEHIRGKSSDFKAVCSKLNVDVVFPLLLITGVFEPRDITRFRAQYQVRRNWLDNPLLLRVPENIRLAEPSSYCFDSLLTVTSPEGTDSWWCEKAVFKIRRLIDIQDNQAVETIVDELLIFCDAKPT
jgi:hypothetical protein